MTTSADLVGTYRLQSFRNIADDGEVEMPFGSDPTGQIIYTAGGYMSAILMRSDRVQFEAGDILDARDDERLGAFASSSAYSGSYAVEDDQIVHRLAVTTYPNWTGTTQVRDFELTGTHFTLFPPRMLMHGKMRRGEVRWERIE